MYDSVCVQEGTTFLAHHVVRAPRGGDSPRYRPLYKRPEQHPWPRTVRAGVGLPGKSAAPARSNCSAIRADWLQLVVVFFKRQRKEQVGSGGGCPLRRTPDGRRTGQPAYPRSDRRPCGQRQLVAQIASGSAETYGPKGASWRCCLSWPQTLVTFSCGSGG